jgi:uncharacterized membrane protein
MDRRDGFQPYLDHGGHGHPVFHILFLVLLALLVATAIFYVLQARRADTVVAVPAGGAAAADALEVVRMRYARGEIGRDEYLRMSADFGAPVEPEPAPTEPAAPEADDSTTETKS